MIEFIEKRDGAVVGFDKQKIINAIIPAMKEAQMIDYEYAIEIANKIHNLEKDIVKVEEIQDIVEKELMKKYPNTAKRYIIYRNDRSKIREMKSDLIKKVKEKTYAMNILNANANVNEMEFSAKKNEAASVIMKDLAVKELLDPSVKQAWENNYLYLHDLEFYILGTHNCLNVDEQHLLLNGFETRNGGVRGAKSLNTAIHFISIIMDSVENDMFGGIGDLHLDRTLAPFVRISFLKHYKDGLEFANQDKEKTWDKFKDKYDNLTLDKASIIAKANIFKDYSESAYTYAIALLEREGTQSLQALCHNNNTLNYAA